MILFTALVIFQLININRYCYLTLQIYHIDKARRIVHYFRANITLHRIGTQQKLYHSIFKIDQSFCKLSERREEYLPNLPISFIQDLIQKIRATLKHNKKYHFSKKKGAFSLSWESLNVKVAFSLHFKKNSSKK